MTSIAMALLNAIREAGWSVAVHNDYQLHGEHHTFWLFTHPNGRYLKGEGPDDETALTLVDKQRRRLSELGITTLICCPACGNPGDGDTVFVSKYLCPECRSLYEPKQGLIIGLTPENVFTSGPARVSVKLKGRDVIHAYVETELQTGADGGAYRCSVWRTT